MIKTLSYAVTGQRIETTETAMLVAGTVNIYTARFAFDETWDGLQRTADFLRLSGDARRGAQRRPVGKNPFLCTAADKRSAKTPGN